MFHMNQFFQAAQHLHGAASSFFYRSGLLVCEFWGADVTAAGVVAAVAVEPDLEAAVFLASADCFDVDVGGTVVLK